MPLVTMPDGVVVELPDNPTEADLADLRKATSPDVWGGMKRAGMSLARGAGLGLAGMADIMTQGLIDPKTMKPVPSPAAEKIRGMVNEYLPAQGTGYWDAALEGAGGGIGAPQQLIARMLAGAAGNASAKAGVDFSRNLDPRLQELAGAGAGIVGGGLAGALMPRVISGAPNRIPEQDLAKDSSLLANIALNRVGPRVSTEDVANQVGDAATLALGQTKRSISDELSRNLAKIPDAPMSLAVRMQDALRRGAVQTPMRGEAEAIQQLAQAITSNNKYRQIGPGQFVRAPLQNAQNLSIAIREFKDNPPTMTAGTGSQISGYNAGVANRLAEDELRKLFPSYGTAMDNYANRMRGEFDPLQESVVGKLAGKTLNNPDPLAPSALNAITAKQSPEGISETLNILGGAAGPPSTLSRDIARALLQEKLAKGPVAPGRAVYGSPGSLDELRFNALVDAGRANPAAVRAPLEAADTLAATAKQQGPMETASFGTHGIAARALLKPAMFARMAAKAEYSSQLSKLLQSATPEELAQLRQLSVFDPNVRALLGAQGAMIPTLEQEGR